MISIIQFIMIPEPFFPNISQELTFNVLGNSANRER